MLLSSSFYFVGSKAACAYMHSLCETVNLNGYVLNVRIPNSVRSSMRMAYVVSEMYALATNITFSHFDTSLSHVIVEFVSAEISATLIY